MNYYSPNDTLKDHGIDDVEWVEFGTGDVAWKTTSMDSQYTGTAVEVPVINESQEYAPVPYVIKVNDLDLGIKMADISIAKAEAGAKPVNDVLFLDNGTGGTVDNLTGVNGENLTEEKSNWCQIDHELKVEITGITEDSQGTPHAQFKYYKRGNPKLEIGIESSTETYKEVSVGAENYFPGRDKDIIIRIKNSGDAWAESIKLDVDFVGFDLSGNRTNLSESGVEINSRHLFANLGWMAKGDERSINFTVKAPAWDKTSSPFEMDPCNITAIALGDDILGYEHKWNTTLSCKPVSPEPDMTVSQKLYAYSHQLEDISKASQGSESNSTGNEAKFSDKNEIFMSSWHIKGSEVQGLKGYCVLRKSLYNVEDYRLKNLTFVFPPLPEGLLIAKAYKNGEPIGTSNESLGASLGRVTIQIPGKNDSNTLDDIVPKSVKGKGSYIMSYILVPTRPGIYPIGSFSVSADCYGHNLSKTSEAFSLTVHGPHILVNKSIETSGQDKVDMVVTVKNDGDRAASINLSDRIPLEARLVPDSIKIWHNGQLQNTTMPLKIWELSTHKEKDYTSVSVAFPAFPPEPGDSYDLKYSIKPGALNNLNLPYAKVDFEDRNSYRGTVRSSFFKSGAEVKQAWDYYGDKWNIISEHWDASSVNWETNWDPITNQWTNVTIPPPANDSEVSDASLAVPTPPPKEKSALDKIKDFIMGLLPGGKKDQAPSNLSEKPAGNTSGNDTSVIGKVKNFFTGLLGGKKDTAPAPGGKNDTGSIPGGGAALISG